MGKILSSGSIDVDGETISYEYYRGGHAQQGGYKGYVIAFYDGKKIREEDHGFGLDHALSLLRNEIKTRKSNKQDLHKE